MRNMAFQGTTHPPWGCLALAALLEVMKVCKMVEGGFYRAVLPEANGESGDGKVGKTWPARGRGEISVFAGWRDC